MEGISTLVITYVPEHEESDAKETASLATSAAPSGSDLQVHLLPADFRTGGESSLQSLARDILEKTEGRVDVLFNNAAYQNEVQKLEDLAYEQLTRTIQVNLIAMIALTKELLPSIPQGGSIVNNAR